MNGNQINIRETKYEDLPAILGLVNELAVFEREPEAVTASLIEYQEAFNEGLLISHVAETELGDIVGMTVAYMTFSTWKGKCVYLEDFYVQPEYRGTGIGKKLFQNYLEVSKSLNAKQLKWQVLDWNQKAVDFYESQGAVLEKDWWNVKIYF